MLPRLDLNLVLTTGPRFESRGQHGQSLDIGVNRTLQADHFASQLSQFALENAKWSKQSVGAVTTNDEYFWYMERLLISTEQIKIASPRDKQWHSALVYLLKGHYRYLSSPEFLGDDVRNFGFDATAAKESTYCTYLSSVRSVIQEAIDAGIAKAKDVRPFVDPLALVEKQCAFDDDPDLVTPHA